MKYWFARVGSNGVELLCNGFCGQEHSVATQDFPLVHHDVPVVVPLQVWTHCLFVVTLMRNHENNDLVDVVLVGGRCAVVLSVLVSYAVLAYFSLYTFWYMPVVRRFEMSCCLNIMCGIAVLWKIMCSPWYVIFVCTELPAWVCTWAVLFFHESEDMIIMIREPPRPSSWSFD